MAFMLERVHEHAGAEQRDPFAPQPRPGRDAAVLDGDGVAVGGHDRAVGRCWPGNRNDVIVARHTVAHLLHGTRPILGDGRYRGIDTITSPRRATDGRIIHDDHYRKHRRTRARVEHVIARLKDWQILRQCRRRGQAINHSLHIVAGLWNLKTRGQLRVNS
jgi:DDE superfamily endonuclease